MTVTDKRGANRKRMLISRGEEKQTQWVVWVTDKMEGKVQRERGCYSTGQTWKKNQTQWEVRVTDEHMGQRERGCYSVGQKKSRHMNSLTGSEQPKKSESLNQIVSQYGNLFLPPPLFFKIYFK